MLCFVHQHLFQYYTMSWNVEKSLFWQDNVWLKEFKINIFWNFFKHRVDFSLRGNRATTQTHFEWLHDYLKDKNQHFLNIFLHFRFCPVKIDFFPHFSSLCNTIMVPSCKWFMFADFVIYISFEIHIWKSQPAAFWVIYCYFYKYKNILKSTFLDTYKENSALALWRTFYF